MTTEVSKPANNKVYKVIIALLAVAIIVVGGVLLAQTFLPTDSGPTEVNEAQLAGLEEGSTIVEVTEDEDGNVTYNERTVGEE